MFHFYNPLLLIALSAVLIPIAVHVISRHRAKVIPFSSIVFLEASVRERAGIKRIQELLTLLLRCLLILFLVLAASKPLLKRSKGSILGAGSETDVIILLDNSCSMGYREGDTNLFEQAVSMAESILKTLAENDRAIILTSHRAENSQSSWDEATLEQARKQLGNAKLTMSSTSILQELQASLDMMNSATGAIREIHVISDFQTSILNEPDIIERIRSNEQRVSVYLIPTVKTRGQNTAVESIQLLEPFPLAERPVTVSARIHNRGDKATVETAILDVDGKRISKKQVRLKPDEAQNVRFHFEFEQAGRHHAKISLQDEDPLAEDNYRHLPITINEALSVLVVDGGDPSLGPLAESFYLKMALTPHSGTGAIKPEVITAADLPKVNVESFAVFMFANVPEIDTDTLKALERAVEKGASAALFLGERVQPLSSLYAGSALCPIELKGRTAKDESSGYALQSIDFSHPLFRRFQQGETGNLSRVLFREFWKLEADSDVKARTLASFDDGSPALMEFEYGRGNVVIFASKCDADWSDFPRRPTYLPFIQQLVDYLSPSKMSAREFLVGQEVPFSYDFRDARVPIAIDRSGKHTYRLVAMGQEKADTTFRETDESGYYLVDIYRPDGLKQDVFAVNIDSTESDMTPTAQQALEDLVPGRTTFVAEDQKLPELLRRHREGVELWGNMLFLVLMIAAMECYMANRSTAVG
ncbi:MAG: BatA domain-containing protein [Planctomycetota bacterium]|nr:BatA domain-containing protein [Planctomycetota bacterium]